MEPFRRYEFEGETLEIPLYWDERSQKYLEDYGGFLERPVATRTGRPLLLTIEDACPCAAPESGERGRSDCGSCRYYHQFPGSLLGVCRNEKRRSRRSGPTPGTKEETSCEND